MLLAVVRDGGVSVVASTGRTKSDDTSGINLHTIPGVVPYTFNWATAYHRTGVELIKCVSV